MFNRGTHWKSLYYSDREFYELCYWRAATYYADEYEDLEKSPAALEVVYGSRMSSLTLDFIDGEAVSLFGWGYCGFLALALHELTGYRLALFTNPEDADERGWHGHAAVVLPDGSFLDIEGVTTVTEINERYDFKEPVEPTFPALDEYRTVMFGAEKAANPYGELDALELRLLRHFAELVVRQYKVELPALAG